ncbi:MAG: YqgE/AlgH family protein [Reinekea sp.]
MNLSNQFLIAMPEMADPIFAGTVTYILQHDTDGAIGLIINRPINLLLGDVLQSSGFEHFDFNTGERPVYHGGPVAPEQGFILHPHTEQHWQGSLQNHQLSLTTTHDILQAIADGEGPDQFLFCLGYSGWSAGQIEEELKQNAWLTVDATNDIIFGNDEEHKYQQALSTLGIDLTMLSGHGGMA